MHKLINFTLLTYFKLEVVKNYLFVLLICCAVFDNLSHCYVYYVPDFLLDFNDKQHVNNNLDTVLTTPELKRNFTSLAIIRQCYPP